MLTLCELPSLFYYQEHKGAMKFPHPFQLSRPSRDESYFSQRALQGLVGGFYNHYYLTELEDGSYLLFFHLIDQPKKRFLCLLVDVVQIFAQLAAQLLKN